MATPSEEKIGMCTRVATHYLDAVLPPDVGYTLVLFDKSSPETKATVRLGDTLTPREARSAIAALKQSLDEATPAEEAAQELRVAAR